jgi:hypothetical protein
MTTMKTAIRVISGSQATSNALSLLERPALNVVDGAGVSVTKKDFSSACLNTRPSPRA